VPLVADGKTGERDATFTLTAWTGSLNRDLRLLGNVKRRCGYTNAGVRLAQRPQGSAECLAKAPLNLLGHQTVQATQRIGIVYRTLMYLLVHLQEIARPALTYNYSAALGAFGRIESVVEASSAKFTEP
jgi:hypothetical protein